MFRDWILIPILAMAAAAQSTPPTVQAEFRVNGTMVDAVHDELLPDIEVSIALINTDIPLRTVITGPDGRFEFGRLAPAKYTLTARGRGYLRQGYEQHQFLSTGIVTGAGLESENLVFRLKPEATISGTVTDEFNEPVRSAYVLLFSAGMPDAPQVVLLRIKAETDDAGYFHFRHLPEGKYWLVVFGRPWYARNDTDGEEQTDEQPSSDSLGGSIDRHHAELDVAYQTRYYTNATDPSQATPIVLKSGERATADFHLFAVPAARLKIRGVPAFANAPGPLILREQIFSSSRRVASQSIDQDGLELTGLAPGRYLLEFPPQAADGLPQQQLIDLVSDMEVGPGEGAKFVSTVSGAIQLEGEKGLCERCFVHLVSLPSAETFGAQSTSKGFQISGGVRPGRYVVWVSKAEGYLVKDFTAVGARVIGTQLEIPPGATVQLTVVMTQKYYTVEGVALRDGKPVSEAEVILVPDDPVNDLALFRRDQSDSDGTFALLRVLPGSYTVVAITDSWDLEWTNPAVLKSYLARGVRVEVQPEGKHQIRVPVQMK
jgi:carboxypeptidase family protein